jgi:hypothetical protein
MNASAAAEGSLYELVSRGNKDVFFFEDKPSSKFIFDNIYEAHTPKLEEMRRVLPKTAVEFGRAIEFEFDLVGDLMKSPTLVIRLPTWLPDAQAKLVKNSFNIDTAGISYGYIQGIAYFLFEKISFYQDNILLQEFSGDTLWAMSKVADTFGQRFVYTEQTGGHGGTPLEISRNAAPSILRLELPLVGCQQGPSDIGFPQRAVTRHTYRLRCKLRKLEDLVESSVPTATAKPTPWGQTLYQQINNTTPATPFNTLLREAILQPKIELETMQIYLPKEVQREMEENPIKIRFSRISENKFTQGQLDYSGVMGGGSSVVSRRLDGRHPAHRMLWYFRNIIDTNANRLYKINTKTNTPYFNTLSLLIAGQVREFPRSPLVWRDVTNFAKEETDSAMEINTMNWSFGAIAPRRFPTSVSQQIGGAVNFSTADKPTLYIDLAQPGNANPITELFVIIEGWAEFMTDGKGRAELLSMN